MDTDLDAPPPPCRGPWQLLRKLMDGLYLYVCKGHGDERIMYAPESSAESERAEP